MIIASIAITTKPDRTEYVVGDELDTTGIAVSVEYTDGTVEALELYDYIVKSSGFIAIQNNTAHT